MDMSSFTPKPQDDIRKSKTTTRGQLPTKYCDNVTFTSQFSLSDYLDSLATIYIALSNNDVEKWKETLYSKWVINEKQHMEVRRLTIGRPYSIVKESWKYPL